MLPNSHDNPIMHADVKHAAIGAVLKRAAL